MKKYLLLIIITLLSNVLFAINNAQIRITFTDGSTSSQTVALKQSPDAGAMRIHIPASEITSNTRYIDVVLDTAKALKGEKGYFVLGDSRLGTFKLDNGSLSCTRVVMPIMGMKTNKETWVAIIKGLKYEFSFEVTAKYGIYEVYPRFRIEAIRRAPYEDIIVDFYKLSDTANYCDMGKVYRNYQLNRGEVKPLKERVKGNPRLKYTAESMFVRIKNGGKSNSAQIEHQTPENEPKVSVYHSFDDFMRIMTSLKNYGLDKVEMCFVGWHSGGFDGRYPDLAPVEEAFGGEVKMREAIELGKSYGYQMTCHVTHTDHYTIATRFDWNNISLDYNGAYQKHSILPGGRAYYGCFQQTYEKIFPEDFEFLKSLGLNGTLHIDVTSCIVPYHCFHTEHPCTKQDTADYMNKIAEKAEEHFAGFSSEGPCDHVAKTLDYALYVTAWPKYVGAREEMVDKIIPLWQTVYHGIILSNPYYSTIDYPFDRAESDSSPYYSLKNKTERRLKFFEYGGRLTFYFINYKNLQPIRDAYWEYQPVKYLQYEFIDDHREVSENVFTTVYSDGSEIVTNYTDSDFTYKGEIVKAQDFRLYKANEVSISTKETTVFVNEEFEITAVSSSPNAKWKWLKNGEIIKGATSATLKISQSEQSARYAAIAQTTGETISNEIIVNTVEPRLYVSKSGNDENDGSSWTKALLSISKAVEIANQSPDKKIEVWITKDSYTEGQVLEITSPIKIVGGFLGTESDASFRDRTNKTILAGDGSSRVINVSAVAKSIECDGVIFKNAFGEMGGAVYSEAPLNTFTNCGFTDNNSTVGAGAIAVVNATKSVFENCSFANNSSGYGGAFHSPNAGLVIMSNCSFVYNSAVKGGGGAIDIGADVELKLANCTIYSNKSVSNGGAIDSWEGYLSVYNTLMCDNIALKKNNDINADVRVESVYNSVISAGANGSNVITDVPELVNITDSFGLPSVRVGVNENFAIGSQFDNVLPTDAAGIERTFPCYVGAYEPKGVSTTVPLPSNVQNFTLTANGYENDSPTYQWYKNGVLINGATSQSITITQSEVSASYVCKINTSFGTVSLSYDSKISVPNCVYVSDLNGDDSLDGLSPKTSKKTLQKAIDIVNTNTPSVIKIESGTYKPTSPIGLKGNLTIEGGYDFAKDILTPTNETDTIFDGQGIYHLFDVNNIQTPLTVKNIVFQNASADESGGAIIINRSSPYFIDCVFKNNYARWNGASAVVNTLSSPKFENCHFENNATMWSSPAVYMLNAGTTTFLNCSFVGNEGVVSSALHCNNSTLVCENCTFSDNGFNVNSEESKRNVESVVSTNASSVSIRNCTFVGKNKTSGYAVSSNSGSVTTIENSIFWDTKNVPTALASSAGEISVSNSISDKEYPNGVNIIRTNPNLSEDLITFGRIKAYSIASNGSAAFTGVKSDSTPTVDARGMARANPCCIGAIELPILDYAQVLNKTVQKGQSVSFVALASSDSSYSFQWEKFDGSNWNKIDGATSNTFTILNATTLDSAQYRCKVVAMDCVLYSPESKLLVDGGIEIISSTDAAIAKLNEQITLDVSATGTDLCYQWQRSSDGQLWVDIDGAEDSQYSFVFPTNSNLYKFYRCKVYNGTNTVYTTPSYVALSQFKVVGEVKVSDSEDFAGRELIFTDSSILRVDTDVSVSKILFDTSKTVNAKIVIDEGKTLTVVPDAKNYLLGDSTYGRSSSKIVIEGDGTLNLKSGIYWRGVNADIKTYITSSGSGIQFHQSDVRIGKSWIGTRFLHGGGCSISIADGAYVDTSKSSYCNLHSLTGSFNLGETPTSETSLAKFLIGASDSSSGSFFVSGTSNINGILYIRGYMAANLGSSNTQFCTINTPDINFKEFAYVEQTCDYELIPAIFKNVSSCAKENSLKISSPLFLTGGNLYLNTSNAFNIGRNEKGEFNTQADSSFKISDFRASKVVSISDVSDAYSATSVNLTLNARNDVGSFDFYPNSTLTISLNNNVLTVGKFKLMEGTSGTFTIIITDYQKNRIRIRDMSAEEIAALNIVDANGNKLAFNLLPATDSSERDFWLDGLSLLSHPTTTSIYTENSARFSVSVEGGSADTTFQWQESSDGGNTWTNIKNATSSAYRTPIINDYDEIKLYRCIISDGDITIVSNPASIGIRGVCLKKVYISKNGDNSDGRSWTTAFSDLRKAIQMCSENGAEIWIAKGTYSYNSLALKNNVAIYGGFAGTETTKEERVSGNDTIFTGPSNNKIVSISTTNRATVLSDITFTHPEATFAAITGTGSATIKNCRFVDCFTINGNSGGAMNFGAGCSPTIINCEFINCSTQWSGGAIYLKEGAIKIENCYFEGCNSKYAGVLHSNKSTVEIINSTFYKNYSNSSEEVLHFANGSTASVKYCTMIQHPEKNGCAIEVDVSSCEVYNSIMLNNNRGGVVHLANSATFATYNCIVDYKYGNTDIVATDASLMPVGYYGGNVKTMPAISESVAVNAGKVLEGITTDARGFARSTTATTIGACEFVPTSISEHPQSTTVWENASATFKIVSPVENSTYQWQYSVNGSTWIDIKDETSSILSLTEVKYSQNNCKYRCKIDSDSTDLTYSNFAVLTIKQAPSIVTQPNALNIIINADGNLSVSVNGEDLAYQWYFNGDAIEGATEATLSFENVQKDKSGSYYCVITNPAGSVQTEAVVVNVREPIFYVVENGAGNLDGSSWANAYADVQIAVDMASSIATIENPVEVWIAKGTYKHGSAMTMKNNVAIYGGFAGTETSKDQRVAGQNKTYLDGEGKYNVFYNYYSSSNPLTNSAKLDNVIIQNGKTSEDGAGMYNYYASPEITNCTFCDNSASDGGGIFNYSSCPKLTNCTFINNSVSLWGGGMYNYDNSNTLLVNCTFIDNIASHGGALCSGYSKPIFVNCTILNNYAENAGGMYNNSSSPTLTNCTFSNNSAEYYGGGMYNYRYNGTCNPVLINCILWGNTASSGGNEIYNRDSNCKPTIDTCIIKGGVGDSYGTYTNIITADPKLMPLGNYGGSVQTIAVAAGSSAIETGKVMDEVYTDARGYMRSHTTPTIGAYEYETDGVPNKYDKWAIKNKIKHSHFGKKDIPHHDGITNLEKFVFGLDVSKATSYSSNAKFKHSSGNKNASLQFPVSVDAEDVIQIKALMSTDLINWREITITATGETSPDGKFKIYKVSTPINDSDGKVFLKLQLDEKK